MKAKRSELDCMILTTPFEHTCPFSLPALAARPPPWPGGLERNNKARRFQAAAANRSRVFYAAGEVTGGVHGMVRLGTVAATTA